MLERYCIDSKIFELLEETGVRGIQRNYMKDGREERKKKFSSGNTFANKTVKFLKRAGIELGIKGIFIYSV